MFLDKNNNISVLFNPVIFYVQLYRANHPISQLESTWYNEKKINRKSNYRKLKCYLLLEICYKKSVIISLRQMLILIIMPED